MDVVSDETSPEKKSIHEQRRKSLPPSAEKPKVVASRKPLPEPEEETPEAEQTMSSKMVDTPQDKWYDLLFSFSNSYRVGRR